VRDTVVLLLINLQNDYVQAMQRVALLTAQRRGFRLEVAEAGEGGYDRQLEQVRTYVQSPLRQRLLALLVHPLLEGVHEPLAREAVSSGIGWVLLNRDAPYLEELRAKNPRAAVFAVTPDHVEIGRLQARVARTLLPRGGKILCITGPVSASASRQRRTGMEQELAGANMEVSSTYGDWSLASGEYAINFWERRLGETTFFPDLVVAQNDAMALGARRALLAAATRGASRLATLPVIGCDGVRDFGIRLVEDKVLTATVVVPGTASPAIDALHNWRHSGRVPDRLLLQPVSVHPALETLKPAL
jgi:ABC-type sugar transport system substrate-binding protein